MSELQIGQVLSLTLPLDNNGKLRGNHPYIIFEIDSDMNTIEIVQLSSLDGKEYEAIFPHNKVVYKERPLETVIDKDSFVRLNYKITLDLFEDLVKYRRQTDKLKKFDIVSKAYKEYHNENAVEDSHIIYVSEERLKELN